MVSHKTFIFCVRNLQHPAAKKVKTLKWNIQALEFAGIQSNRDEHYVDVFLSTIDVYSEKQRLS